MSSYDTYEEVDPSYDEKTCNSINCQELATDHIQQQAGDKIITLAVCEECKKFFVEDNPK